MKKFALFLLILVALGGVVFFFGWVQLQVPPGSVGIIRSKTHGLDPRPVQEGEFRWIWYRLIPTNTQVTIFRPDLTEKSIRISGTLPSGELYSTFAGLDEDFSYAVSGALTFSIKVDALPGLMERQYITNQEDLDAFGQRLADEITGLVNRRLLSMEPDTLETMLETG
ncbi:MAG: hypothetical protein LBT11_04135, partial [Treponema sp.]|nr:hypothetical protein [Treponema sp.]